MLIFLQVTDKLCKCPQIQICKPLDFTTEPLVLFLAVGDEHSGRPNVSHDA